MIRSRLALMLLSGALLASAGCSCVERDPCACSNGGLFGHGWFSGFRLTSRNKDCDCAGGNFDGHGMMSEGPALPPGAIVNPGPTMPPIGTGTGTPPRIIEVPQANPMPFVPG